MRKCIYSPEKDCPFTQAITLSICISCWKATTERLSEVLKEELQETAHSSTVRIGV